MALDEGTIHLQQMISSYVDPKCCLWVKGIDSSCLRPRFLGSQCCLDTFLAVFVLGRGSTDAS